MDKRIFLFIIITVKGGFVNEQAGAKRAKNDTKSPCFPLQSGPNYDIV